MGIKFLAILSVVLVSCSSLPSNFKIETDVKKVNFDCSLTHKEEIEPYLENLYIDTFINIKLISNYKNDVYYFHSNNFVVPNEKLFSPMGLRSDQLIIRYYDKDKNELYGSLLSINIDSSFADPKIFEPEIIDTMTYKLSSYDTIYFNNKIQLPYLKGTLFITIRNEICESVKFINFCISQGRKKKNKLYGIECTDFIEVVQK